MWRVMTSSHLHPRGMMILHAQIPSHPIQMRQLETADGWIGRVYIPVQQISYTTNTNYNYH